MSADSAAAPATAAPPAKAGARASVFTRTARAPLPLPDPLPAAPVKRYAEPSRAELAADVEKVDAGVQAAFDRLKGAKGFYDARARVREEARPAIEMAKKSLQAQHEVVKAMFEEKKAVSAQIKALRDADAALAGGGGKSGAAGLDDASPHMRGLRTPEDVNARILELEERQMSTSVELNEEKKLVAAISFLNSRGRDAIAAREAAFKADRASRDSRFADRKTLEDKRKGIDAAIDEAKKVLDKCKAAMDAARGNHDKKVKALADDLPADVDRDAEKATITQLKAQIKAMREKYAADHDQWYLNERIAQEQIKLAKKKKWEAANAEREAKRIAWEEEQAQYPTADPYQPEKDMCASLIHLLHTLSGTGGTAAARAAAAVASPAAATTPVAFKPMLKKPTTTTPRSVSSLSGGTVIGKATMSDETSGFEGTAYGDFAVGNPGKKGKKARGRGAAAAAAADPAPGATIAANGNGAAVDDDDSDAKLKHLSLDHLTFFTNLGIKAPVRRSDLKPALDAVLEKKAYFDNDPPSKEEIKKAEKAAKAALDGKTADNHSEVAKKTPKESLNGGAAFPGLGSAKSDCDALPAANVAPDTNRPSFIDIARGNAKAPDFTAEDAATSFEEGKEETTAADLTVEKEGEEKAAEPAVEEHVAVELAAKDQPVATEPTSAASVVKAGTPAAVAL
jgi:hypothetical protein